MFGNFFRKKLSNEEKKIQDISKNLNEETLIFVDKMIEKYENNLIKNRGIRDKKIRKNLMIKEKISLLNKYIKLKRNININKSEKTYKSTIKEQIEFNKKKNDNTTNYILSTFKETNYDLLYRLINSLFDKNLNEESKKNFKKYLENNPDKKEDIIKILKSVYRLQNNKFITKNEIKKNEIKNNLNNIIIKEPTEEELFTFLMDFLWDEKIKKEYRDILKGNDLNKEEKEFMNEKKKVIDFIEINYKKMPLNGIIFLFVCIIKIKSGKYYNLKDFILNEENFRKKMFESVVNITKKELKFLDYLYETFLIPTNSQLSYEKTNNKTSILNKLKNLLIYLYKKNKKNMLMAKIKKISTGINLPVSFHNFDKTKYFICNSSNFQDGIVPTIDYLQENFTFLIENGLITINKKIKDLYDQTNQQMDKLISGDEINFKKVLDSYNIKYEENTKESLHYTTNENDKTIINMDNIMNNLDDYMKNKNNFAKEFDEKVLGKNSIKNDKLDVNLGINIDNFDKLCEEYDGIFDCIYIYGKDNKIRSHKKKKQNFNIFSELFKNFKPNKTILITKNSHSEVVETDRTSYSYLEEKKIGGVDYVSLGTGIVVVGVAAFYGFNYLFKKNDNNTLQKTINNFLPISVKISKATILQPSEGLTDANKIKKIDTINKNLDELVEMQNTIYSRRLLIKMYFNDWGNNSMKNKDTELHKFEKKIWDEIARLIYIHSKINPDETQQSTSDKFQGLVKRIVLERKKINQPIVSSKVNESQINITQQLLYEYDNIKDTLLKNICNNTNKTLVGIKKYENLFMELFCKFKLKSREIFMMDIRLFIIFVFVGIALFPLIIQLMLGFVVIVNGKRWVYEWNGMQSNAKK
jgi:hypothetical protein